VGQGFESSDFAVVALRQTNAWIRGFESAHRRDDCESKFRTREFVLCGLDWEESERLLEASKELGKNLGAEFEWTAVGEALGGPASLPDLSRELVG
jgi:hypothetical protein